MGDILILAILIIMTVIGYKKGFLKTLTKLVSIILAFVIAVCFSSTVASFIKTTSIYDKLSANVESYIATPETESENVYDYGTQSLNLPRQYIDKLQKNIDSKKESIENTITSKIIETSVNLISIILLFVITRIVLGILFSLFGLIKTLPVIGWCDKLLGALFGFVRGFLTVYIILAIIVAVSCFNPQNAFINTVKQSEFAKIMYNNNVFLDFIYKD